MGQNQSSTRRITVINDEASGVIKISDAVVQRLKDEMSRPQPSPQPASSQAPSASPSPPPPPAQPSPPPPPPHQPLPPPPPAPQPVEAPPPPPREVRPQSQEDTPRHQQGQYSSESLSALKVRAEKEDELKYVEGYWQDRVKRLRDSQLKREEVNEESFRETVEAVDKLFLKTLNKPVCQDRRHAVLKCYQQNRGKTLLCADEVRLFAKCVESARLGSVGRTG